MRGQIAIVYNEPSASRYSMTAEDRAVFGVLEAVDAVKRAATGLGYEAVTVPLAMPPEAAGQRLAALRVDLVFNLFEGFTGYPETEAFVPELLAELGIPYTGCDAATLKLALNKPDFKRMLRAAGIPTADFELVTPETLSGFSLGFPCIVKPAAEDASHGITADSVVRDFASLERQVKAVCEHYGGRALVEKFLGGREFNVTVMGNTTCEVLPISEIEYRLPPELPPVLSFEAKWSPESTYYRGTQVICPAVLSSGERESISRTALRVYELAGCRGYARVDMRFDASGIPNVLELNPNPDISPDAGAARQARACGLDYTRFIEKIIDLALERRYGHPHPSHGGGRQVSAHADPARHARVQDI
ncbi:MAG: hypothetical protein N2506_01025 [Dehalococcoidales bacterium]|nr:hypothetical protein [Dehalococcoidales bacterium]